MFDIEINTTVKELDIKELDLVSGGPELDNDPRKRSAIYPEVDNEPPLPP